MRPKQGTRKENPSLESYRHSSTTRAKRERRREGGREPHGEAKPPNLLIIAFFRLSHFACILKVLPLLQAYTCNKKKTKPTDKQKGKKQIKHEANSQDKQTRHTKGQTSMLSNK